MNLRFAALTLATLFAAAAHSAALAGNVPLDVHAGTLEFFSDRLLLAARGGVSVDLGSGRRLRADSAIFDLRANKLIAAGNVAVIAPRGELSAAALALDLKTAQAYAVVADPLPDTLAFNLGDNAPARHEAAPPTTFALPALEGIRPWIHSRHARLTPGVAVEFIRADFPTGSGLKVPSPRFTFIFADNPNYTNSNLPPASFDQPYTLHTGPHSALLSHLRYDSNLGATLALDQHLVFGDTTYAVASIAPLNRPAKAAQLNFSQKMGAKLNHSLTANYTEFGSGLSQPLAASLTTQYALTAALRRSYLTLALSQSNNSLLGPPPNGSYYGDPGHGWNGAHPFSAELQWNGYDLTLPKKFLLRLRSAYGYEHDAFAGAIPKADDPLPYNTVWHHTLGFALSSPLVTLPRGATLLATLDRADKRYSFPHRNVATTLTTTLSKRLNKTLNLVGTFNLRNTIDDYPGKQTIFYLPPKLPYLAPDGTPWPGFLAYSGATTNRTYRADAYYTPSAYLNVSLSFVKEIDFPQFHGYGSPPYSVSFDVRARPLRSLAFELGRSYYFNWNKLGWSPQWTFAVSP